MKEINLSSESEKQQFSARTLERFGAFLELDDTQPFTWKRALPAHTDANGEYHPSGTKEEVLDVKLLKRLKEHAIFSEFTQAVKLGAGYIAEVMLHPSQPKEVKKP